MRERESMRRRLVRRHGQMKACVLKRPWTIVLMFLGHLTASLLAVAVMCFPVIYVHDCLYSDFEATWPLLALTAAVVLPTLITIWLHFILLYLQCLGFAIREVKGMRRGFKVLQVIALVVIMFACAHYYNHLLSHGTAYKGLSPAETDRDWDRRYHGTLDHLVFVPSFETVLDCLYFSVITTATVGYGDVSPQSPVARFLTTAQVITSFFLVVVALSCAFGGKTEGEHGCSSAVGRPGMSLTEVEPEVAGIGTEELVRLFQEYDISSLLEYSDTISSKTEDNQDVFPPYIPFIGNNYTEHRILIYAMAQNISEGALVSRYTEHFDKLAERLWYDDSFAVKYPAQEFRFEHVDIAPYQEGILPALVGIYLYCRHSISLKSLDDVQEHLAVSNYYKFSLREDGKDLNPDTLPSPEWDQYYEINDALVSKEIAVLDPQVVLAFGGRHVEVLNRMKASSTGSFDVIRINDPSWIKRGHSGCLKESGSWGRDVAAWEHSGIEKLIDGYLGEMPDLGGKSDPVRIYLKKYAKEWSAQSG